MLLPIVSATANTWRRSAEPSSSGGVSSRSLPGQLCFVLQSEVPSGVDCERDATVLLGTRIAVPRTRRDLALELLAVTDGAELRCRQVVARYHDRLHRLRAPTRQSHVVITRAGGIREAFDRHERRRVRAPDDFRDLTQRRKVAFTHVG